jgi:peptidoglycan/LPS O-acetylase OafA/YrhL
LGLGFVGLGCCVGPAIAALVGVISATVAVDLATDLYKDWGWAFKLVAACLGIVAVLVAKRKAVKCSIAQPRIGRLIATLVLTGLVTYGALYAVTTRLGELA